MCGGIHQNIECLVLALVVCLQWIFNGNEAACYKSNVLKIYAFFKLLVKTSNLMMISSKPAMKKP
jgi:hypothetical protein